MPEQFSINPHLQIDKDSFYDLTPIFHSLLRRMTDRSDPSWQTHDRFLELRSRWMTLIGEHLEDHQGRRLEYWRIEKADSVIILPLQGDRLLLPTPSYRPGVGQITLDFPGGRVAVGQSAEQAAVLTLERELGIPADAISQLAPLNTNGWLVNSSFSNQKLYGFVAHIEHTSAFEMVAATYSTNRSGIQELLQKLTCLQCRALLLEWCRNTSQK